MWTPWLSTVPALLLGLALVACVARLDPCTSDRYCFREKQCLEGAGVSSREQLAGASIERRVLWPVSIAVCGQHQPTGELPTSVTLGGRGQDDALLLLRFEPDWSFQSRVRKAFLVLEPLPGTGPTAEDFLVDVWTILEPWDPDHCGPAKYPALGPPHSRGLLPSGPPTTVRVEATDLVHTLTARGRRRHGLALAASSGQGHGMSFATGAGQGPAPSLEVYLEPVAASL